MERSAEWLRGAAHAAAECKQFKAAVWYQMLLAEAEAREASVPTAAEVIAAVEEALQRLEDLAYDWVNEAGSAAHELANTAQHRAEKEARQEFEACRTAALALIAKWKEAHNA
jgi:hypothetical protein